jgi:Domain of unknown function (DUF4190)/Septum formation
MYGAVAPGGPWGPAPYAAPDLGPQRSAMATAALVLGIIGVVACFVFVFSVLALVFGLLAARTIKRSNGAVIGIKMARAGWILGVIGLLIGGAFIAAGLSGAFDEEGVTDLDDVEVGDCVNIDAIDGDAIRGLPAVDCAELHEGEVYFVGQLNADRDRDYPGDDAAGTEAVDRCSGDLFTEFVGTEYADSEFDVYYIYPQRAQWSKTRGTFICIVYSLDGATLTGTVRGSNR